MTETTEHEAHQVLRPGQLLATMKRYRAVFLVGGIVDCPDWQEEATALLHARRAETIVVNPRLPGSPMFTPQASHEQLVWEQRMLYQVDHAMAWFPDAPVDQAGALVEVVQRLERNLPLVLGIDPGYRRRTWLTNLVHLSRPRMPIHDTLPDTVAYQAALLDHRMGEAL